MSTSPSKSKKVWNKLFSPPCPNCGSTRTREELSDIPVVGTMKELFDVINNQNKGKPNKPIRTWKCLDCGSTFDEKGRGVFLAKEK